MSAKVYCFASAKGGSGKTILAATFGTVLACLGKRCLLIDADSTTNGMTLLYLEQLLTVRDASPAEATARGIFDVIEGPQRVFELAPNLSFLPATYVSHDTQECSSSAFDSSLRCAISNAQNDFDFVLIDAQAGTDIFARLAIDVSDQLVIVSEYDPISAKGVERLKRLVSEEKIVNDSWILFNKVLPEFAEKLGDFLGVSRYLPPVPWSADVVRAYVRGQLAVDMSGGNLFTLGLLETASVLFGSQITRLVDEWKGARDEQVRAPLKQQLKSIEDEIETMERTNFGLKYQAQILARYTRNFEVTMVFLGGVFAAAIPTLLSIFSFDFSSQRGVWSLATFAVALGGLGIAAVRAWMRRQIRKQREQAETAAEVDRRIHLLEERRQQLQTYIGSSLSDVFGRSTLGIK